MFLEKYSGQYVRPLLAWNENEILKPLFVINCVGRMVGRLVIEEYCESGNFLHTMPGLWSKAEQTHALRRVVVLVPLKSICTCVNYF